MCFSSLGPFVVTGRMSVVSWSTLLTNNTVATIDRTEVGSDATSSQYSKSHSRK